MEGENGDGGCGSFGRVMTEEQMELLRKQIAAFVVITEQLAEMYRSISIRQGIMLGNPYGPVVSGHQIIQIPTRQRWNPTTEMLQILEGLYKQGQGTPCKQRIKEITSQLTQLDQVTETNVYNWFQNRRARTKKQQMAPTAKSKDDADVLTAKNKRKEPENTDNSEVFEDSELGILIGDHQSYSSYSLADQIRFL